MKRTWRIVILSALVAALTLGGTMVVSAWGPDRGMRPVGRLMGDALDAVADLLGMDADGLRDALRRGDTVADLAEEQGVALDDLRTAAETAHQEAARERIADAVESGDLDEAEAEWMLRGIDAGYSAGMQAMGPGGRMGPRGPVRGAMGLESVAELLGITEDELHLQLWAGRTFEDLAELHGVTVEEIENAMEQARIEAASEAIAEAVEAGDITQAQADWMLEGLTNGYGQGPRAMYDGVGQHPGQRGGRSFGARPGGPAVDPRGFAPQSGQSRMGTSSGSTAGNDSI